jgi:hypothetical protein
MIRSATSDSASHVVRASLFFSASFFTLYSTFFLQFLQLSTRTSVHRFKPANRLDSEQNKRLVPLLLRIPLKKFLNSSLVYVHLEYEDEDADEHSNLFHYSDSYGDQLYAP